MILNYKMRQVLLQNASLFYYKMRQKFIIKYVRFSITKCESYYKMRRYTVHRKAADLAYKRGCFTLTGSSTNTYFAMLTLLLMFIFRFSTLISAIYDSKEIVNLGTKVNRYQNVFVWHLPVTYFQKINL